VESKSLLESSGKALGLTKEESDLFFNASFTL
jgi:hypothetical protein